jgi:hypothetical protein
MTKAIIAFRNFANAPKNEKKKKLDDDVKGRMDVWPVYYLVRNPFCPEALSLLGGYAIPKDATEDGMTKLMKASVNIYQSTWRKSPERLKLHQHPIETSNPTPL